MSIYEPTISVVQLAELLDRCCDKGGWNGGDVCDAIADLCDDALRACGLCGAVSAITANYCAMCGEPFEPSWPPPMLADGWVWTGYGPPLGPDPTATHGWGIVDPTITKENQ